MKFDIEHDGRTTLSVDYLGALELGYPTEVVAGAIKAGALQYVSRFADGYRSKLASKSASKLAEYRIKEEIARDPESASNIELELLSREAKARGTNRTGLIGQINQQSAAFRQISLLIGALEAEAGAAITMIADDADDIETQIQNVLGAANSQAEIAFNEALALIKGGSNA